MIDFYIGICMLFGLLAIGYAGRAWWRSRSARKWIRAAGRIRRFDSGALGAFHGRPVRYTYEIDGKLFTGSDVSCGFLLDERSRRELGQQYPEGRAVTVFVDPRHPHRSVLEPHATGVAWALVFGLIWLAMGAGLYRYGAAFPDSAFMKSRFIAFVAIILPVIVILGVRKVTRKVLRSGVREKT